MARAGAQQQEAIQAEGHRRVEALQAALREAEGRVEAAQAAAELQAVRAATAVQMAEREAEARAEAVRAVAAVQAKLVDSEAHAEAGCTEAAALRTRLEQALHRRQEALAAAQEAEADRDAVQVAVQVAAVQHEAEVVALQRRLEAQAVAHEAEVGLAVHAAVQVAVQAHEVEAGQARLTIAQLEERLAVDSQVRKDRAPGLGGGPCKAIQLPARMCILAYSVDDGLLFIAPRPSQRHVAHVIFHISCVPVPPSSPPSEARGPCRGPSAQDRAPGHVLPVDVWRRRGP